MKPHRVKMAHSLILHYGLYRQMEVRRHASLRNHAQLLKHRRRSGGRRHAAYSYQQTRRSAAQLWLQACTRTVDSQSAADEFAKPKPCCTQVFKPVPATDEAMSKFHAPDYISFLKHISPDNQVTSMQICHASGSPGSALCHLYWVLRHHLSQHVNRAWVSVPACTRRAPASGWRLRRGSKRAAARGRPGGMAGAQSSWACMRIH